MFPWNSILTLCIRTPFFSVLKEIDKRQDALTLQENKNRLILQRSDFFPSAYIVHMQLRFLLLFHLIYSDRGGNENDSAEIQSST